jgi:alpha-ketoglutaric semialdehyde dehydrogenase
MILAGKNFIGFTNSGMGEKTFQAFSSTENDYLPEKFTQATIAEFETALSLAQKAFPIYSELSYEKRAQFLDAIADEIMALGDTLIVRCSSETGLPTARITGERGRTCSQLKMFAQLLRDGWWLDARIDKAQPDRQPVAKSDIRRMLIPIGPVAIFGASNFPLAFSTAGGDTASAFAAGCTVIVKAHSSHPGTNELVSSAIIKAAIETGMPEGVFSSVYLSHEDSVNLVKHSAIKAVGFTGSRTVGMKLFEAAVSRPEPIPVFAEMSALNPIIVMEHALIEQKENIAKGIAGSVVLGAGQFCTCPGLVLMIDSDAAVKFRTALAEQIAATTPAPMLNKNIHKAYTEGVNTFQSSPEISVLAKSSKVAIAERQEAQPVVHTITAADFISKKLFAVEIFGPETLIVICKDEEELQQALLSLEGQLTASVHASKKDELSLKPIIKIITEKAGRVIYGEYPTGVEVCHSMQHGGPFPATTYNGVTSVGTAAIYRFVRPVAFQNFPNHLLAEALQNENPLNILRLIDGDWTKEAI